MSEEHTVNLLSRLAVDEGTPEDWEAFATLAAGDLSLWRDLAEMQRDQMVLTSAINTAAATADTVPLPAHAGGPPRVRLRMVQFPTNQQVPPVERQGSEYGRRPGKP